jgi:AcrR family transcriptional regulator
VYEFERSSSRALGTHVHRYAAGPEWRNKVDLSSAARDTSISFQLLVINVAEVQQPVKLARKDGAAARRQQILDAACRLVFERGYEPVTLSEIGAAAGVSGPAIYRHFNSKSDILTVLCNRTIDRLIEFVGPRRSSPADELGALVEGQVKLTMVHPELVRVFMDEERSLPETIRREIRRRERDHAQRWVDALRLLRPAASALSLEVLSFSAVGMILSAPRWPKGVRASPDLERELVAAAWRILEF